MIVNYKIVSHINPRLLEEEINRLIQEGYQPYGSLVCEQPLTRSEYFRYNQAMVLKDGFDD